MTVRRIRFGRVGRAGRRALYRAWGVRKLAAQIRPRACVLLYHRVGEPGGDPFGYSVAPESFARQLEAVHSRYNVLSVEQLLGSLHGGDYPDGAVSVTFDDGYSDVLTTAYPIAAAVDIPIHVFVTAGPVTEGDPQFWWDELATLAPTVDSSYAALHDELRRLPRQVREARIAALRDGSPGSDRRGAGRPLSRAELTELASLPLASVGAHTLTHPLLAALPAGEQLLELTESRSRLEEVIGGPVELLAYPFGKDTDVSQETRRLAEEAGYTAAFLSTPRALVPWCDRFALPRLSVHDWSAAELLRQIDHVLGPVRP